MNENDASFTALMARLEEATYQYLTDPTKETGKNLKEILITCGNLIHAETMQQINDNSASCHSGLHPAREVNHGNDRTRTAS